MSENDSISNFSNISYPTGSISPYVLPENQSNASAPESGALPNHGSNESKVQEPKALRLALPASDPELDTDRYAVVPMPNTYEDAQSIAAEVFRRYLGSDVKVEKVVLRAAVKNRTGEWCWADIRAQDWGMMSNISEEVGVFYARTKRKVLISEFLIGKVGLVLGIRTSGGIEWKMATGYPDAKNELRVSDVMIDRPRSFEVPLIVTDNFKKTLERKWLKFHSFSSVNGIGRPVPVWWTEFPEKAYIDDDIWRSVVPTAGTLLGFTVEEMPSPVETTL
ncbi:hypothetical protein BDQ17DRAFT_1371041 [Cyathus striatus]|nr:hypothetical protein BDQ17DRAFT_1371041 [Cyathus striatus]